MALYLPINNGQWSSFYSKFYHFLAIFFILQFCQADSLNDNNVINSIPNTDFVHYNPSQMDIVREQPYREELYFRPYVYTKSPFEIIYRMINENPNSFEPILERPRKYDKTDRSFIRFGRSPMDPLVAKQNNPKLLRQFINYMKRPEKDTSFLRFGKRSIKNSP